MDGMIMDRVHALPGGEVLDLLDSNSKSGLDILEVKARHNQYGPNALPAAAGMSPWMQFLLQFHQPLVYILLAAATITFVLHEFVDSAVIFGVVLVNAIVGFMQEAKAARALEALAQTTHTEARVLRGGEVRTVPSEELVPGDIILLQSGDKVPADMRLLHCIDLQIDESALTGESVPVSKSPDELEVKVGKSDRVNLAFSSTLVTYGQGRGVVYATGTHTEVGRISKLISTADMLQTPLTKKIAEFSKLILVVILVLAGFTFVLGTVRDQPVIDVFMAAVALAVAAIPEGLPAAVTIILAIGVARMAERRAIIRKLPAVETLGSTTTICSDKTGTLTVNQMTVRGIVTPQRSFQVEGTGYEPKGAIRDNAGGEFDANADQAVRSCLLVGLLCNDSSVFEEAGRWQIQGDPTEAALIVAARKGGFDPKEWESKQPRISSIPFESEYQYMATLHEDPDSPQRIVYVKGALEVILRKCRGALGADGQTIDLDPDEVNKRFNELASEGLRVLAFAIGQKPAGTDTIRHEDIGDLTFVGLQGMIDPPRPEAIAAVAACQGAGIHVKMITGDHAVTAQAIATQIGLKGKIDPETKCLTALTAQDLSSLSDEQLLEQVREVAVFARVTPEQKLRLVRALQAKGQVVAMTGDGVNDAPALRQADIGVAMGRGGTEVAKEAADMVLTDDNFATIESAVEEGRGVFDNLTKFIVWTLPTNGGEGLVILAAILFGTALPVSPVQILWINMTTAVLLGMMLAFEPKEPNIMSRKPRLPNSPIVAWNLVIRIALVSGIMLAGAFGSFTWALEQGYSEASARAIAVNVFVFVEVFYLFSCRSLTCSIFKIGFLSNKWILAGVTAMILFQLAFTYLPIMNLLFQSGPFGWDAWVRILGTGVFTYVVVEIEKWIQKWFQGEPAA